MSASVAFSLTATANTNNLICGKKIGMKLQKNVKNFINVLTIPSILFETVVSSLKLKRISSNSFIWEGVNTFDISCLYRAISASVSPFLTSGIIFWRVRATLRKAFPSVVTFSDLFEFCSLLDSSLTSRRTIQRPEIWHYDETRRIFIQCKKHFHSNLCHLRSKQHITAWPQINTIRK